MDLAGNGRRGWAVVALALCGCAGQDYLNGGPIDGMVLEEGTHQPVAGAVVVMEWQGDTGGPVESNTVCYHLEVAASDAQGKFHIPAWSRKTFPGENGTFGLRNLDTHAWAYKAGYDLAFKEPSSPTKVYVSRFSGSPEKRADSLARTGTRGCGMQDGSWHQELILKQAICEEAKGMPGSDRPDPHFQGFSLLQQIDYSLYWIETAPSGTQSMTAAQEDQYRAQVPRRARCLKNEAQGAPVEELHKIPKKIPRINKSKGLHTEVQGAPAEPSGEPK